MIKNLLSCLLLCSLAACASDPARDPQAIHAQCRLEMNAARTAVHLREQGKTRQAMLDTLPPLQKNSRRLLRQLYAIVQEIYRYPKLNDVVYGIYRYDRCTQGLRGHPLPELKAIYPKLLDCQARFDRLVTHQAVACVRSIYSNTRPVRTSQPWGSVTEH